MLIVRGYRVAGKFIQTPSEMCQVVLRRLPSYNIVSLLHGIALCSATHQQSSKFNSYLLSLADT